MHSDAKFVLVVEKEASFQRLMDDNVLQKLHPCIVITGKGFPDVNTRMMVRCLWSTLQIPILALVDADPHGNLSRFAFFTLDGGVAMSPPKYKSLLIINELILSFLPLWSMTAVYKFLSQ